MTMNEAQNFLSQVMRRIDKKTTLTVEPAKQGDRVALLVRLVRDRRVATVQFSEEDITAAQANLMARERVRVALKRAHDGMWQVTGEFASTKMERPKAPTTHWAARSSGRR